MNVKIKEGQLITARDNNQVYEVTESGSRIYYGELGSWECGFNVPRDEFHIHFRETTDEDVVELLDQRMRKDLINKEVNTLRLELELAE